MVGARSKAHACMHACMRACVHAARPADANTFLTAGDLLERNPCPVEVHMERRPGAQARKCGIAGGGVLEV